MDLASVVERGLVDLGHLAELLVQGHLGQQRLDVGGRQAGAAGGRDVGDRRHRRGARARDRTATEHAGARAGARPRGETFAVVGRSGARSASRNTGPAFDTSLTSGSNHACDRFRREPRAVSRRDVLQAGVTVAGGVALSSCAHRSAAATTPVARQRLLGGLEVRGTRFVKDGKPFFVSGINYWAGTTLARERRRVGSRPPRPGRDPDGRHQRGPDRSARPRGRTAEPLRIVPTVHPVAGRFDVAGVAGVLRFADELKMRGLYGIFMLSNFWPWSGGMAQLLAWAGEGPIPYPPPHAARKLGSLPALRGQLLQEREGQGDLRGVRQRTWSPSSTSNPSVIWELANEPRGMTSIAAYRQWIDASAAPDQVAGARPAGHDRERRPDRLADVRRDGRGPGSRERRDRLHLLPHVGAELGLGAQRQPPEDVPAGPGAGQEIRRDGTRRWPQRSASRFSSRSSGSRATGAAATWRPRPRSATATSRRSTAWSRR